MKKTLLAMLGLVIFAASVLAAALVARGVLDWFTNLERDQALAVVALGGLVLTPLISFLTTRAIENKKLTGQAALEHKIELYEEFMDFFVTMMKLDGGSGLSDAEAQKRMAKMTPAIIIYAPNEFLKHWREFRRLSSSPNDPQQLVFVVEELLKSFRKDLGHSSWMLQKGDIVSVFIKDIDELIVK